MTFYLSWVEKQTDKSLQSLKSSLIFPCFYSSPVFTLGHDPDNAVFRSTSSRLPHSPPLAKWSPLPSQRRPIFCTTKTTGGCLEIQEAPVQAYTGGLLLLPFALTQLPCQVPDYLYPRACLSPSALPYWPLGPRRLLLSLWKLPLSCQFLIGLLIWLEWIYLVCVKSQAASLPAYPVQSLNSVMLRRNHPCRDVTKSLPWAQQSIFNVHCPFYVRFVYLMPQCSSTNLCPIKLKSCFRLSPQNSLIVLWEVVSVAFLGSF